MKKVTRIIAYEGDDKWVDETLGRSLPTGTKTLSNHGSITIYEETIERNDLRQRAKLLGIKTEQLSDYGIAYALIDMVEGLAWDSGDLHALVDQIRENERRIEQLQYLLEAVMPPTGF